MQHNDGSTQAAGTRERPVEFHAFAPRRARKLDAGIILVGRDLQVRKCFVVLEIGIKPRLNVLDEPTFQQERVDLAFGFEIVDVADLEHQIRRAPVVLGGFEKVARGAGPQIFCLADINHPPGGIFHEIHAGRLRK